MGSLQTAFVIGIATMINAILTLKWERFKEREALKPQPMVLKKGVYVPWGIVQKVERFGRITTIMWVVYMAILIGLFIYMKFVLGAEHL